MTDKPFVLPPLERPPTYHWLEGTLLRWQDTWAKRRSETHGATRWTFAVLRRVAGRLIRSGRRTPWLYRVWFFLGGMVLEPFPAKDESANRVLIRKAFTRQKDASHAYSGVYVLVNVLTAMAVLFLAVKLTPDVVEAAYILSTYRHDKYTNVVVTSHYRNFAEPHLFDVHGLYKDANGNTQEMFLEIGPSFWFQEYNPEDVFGKISDNAVCDFDGYGVLLRVPLGARYLSGNSLYALNPWAVDARCHLLSSSNH